MAVIENIDLERSPLVTLAGEVDSFGSGRVTDVLAELFESGCAMPRVDMAGVSFIDTAGLMALLKWSQQFRDNEGALEVISINPLVRRLFDLAGLSHIIDNSEEHSIPPPLERQPITDCMASTGDWEVSSFTLPAKLDCCKTARDRIERTMARLPFTREEKADVKLAVGEAISNAIRHGCGEKPWERVNIRCLATIHKLVVEISDPGSGFDPEVVFNEPAPSSLPEGKMGINFMRKCMDEVTFDFTVGTTVILVKYIQERN